jgi:uncharacterized HAD superfamily protein
VEGVILFLVLRIAVDLDGVLADTMVTFCRILNRHHSTQFTVDSFVQWKAWRIAHITESEFFRTLDEAWFEWETIPPVSNDIVEAVGRIHCFGRVDVVTGRSQRTVKAALAWLHEQKIPYDRFVRTASTRAKARLSYDVFVDDSPDLMSLIASSLNRVGILYTQPWNRKARERGRIFRVESWKEIPPLLENVSSMKR